MKKTPAATPTTAPFASFVAFTAISAFASSISSRTNSVARSDTSEIAEAMFRASSVRSSVSHRSPAGGG